MVSDINLLAADFKIDTTQFIWDITFKLMPYSIPIIMGDLIKADVDVIVQQCNCLTTTAHGLSQHIKDHLGVDPYGHRKLLPGRTNCCVATDRDIVGTVKVYQLNNRRPSYVACLFAQLSPGKSSRFYNEIVTQCHDPVTKLPVRDTNNERVIWFQRCLEVLAPWIVTSGYKTVALPYLIGCGLAGGSWSVYEKIITDWGNKNKDNFTTYFYKLN